MTNDDWRDMVAELEKIKPLTADKILKVFDELRYKKLLKAVGLKEA